MDATAVISLLCAVVSSGMAVMQYISAEKSLKAARQIAHDQVNRANRAEMDRRANFLDVAETLGRHIAQRGDEVLAGSQGVHPWRYEADITRAALEAVQQSAPADAALVLAFQRMKVALTFGPNDFMLDTASAAALVRQRIAEVRSQLAEIRKRA